MPFLLAVIHEIGQDPIDAAVHLMHDDLDPPPRATISSRCPCTWERAAADANATYAATTNACLTKLCPANAASTWREAAEAFQLRMRTMIVHPEYGRSDPACPRCGGNGRFDTEAYERLDSASYTSQSWSTLLHRASVTPGTWPVGWELACAFETKLGIGTFTPPPDPDRDKDAWSDEPPDVAAAAPLPVAWLLERNLVPDVCAVVDRGGAWHEREEVEIAEELASWDARIQALLRASGDAQISILSAR